MKKQKIGLMYDLSSDHKLNDGDPKDLYNELDNMKIVRDIKKAIETHGFEVLPIGSFDKLIHMDNKPLESLDIIFNLTEGLRGRGRESLTPAFLEHRNSKFIGSDAVALGISMDKAFTKMILGHHGILTPKYFCADKEVTAKQLAGLEFPLIAKPRWEGSSKGIDKNSKTKNLKELNERIAYIKKYYKQPTIVEEFISGREFTAGIVGNGDDVFCLPVLEITIRGKAVKDRMFVGRYVYSNDVHYQLVEDSELNKKMQDIAKKTYQLIECKDFGRVDFRMNEKGEIYVLEVNPLPALSVQDAMSYAAEKAGLGYAGMIGKIINSGIERYMHE